MRKLVMITSTLLGVAFAAPAFAQSSEASPQPGLPPGAGYRAPNAQPPGATGEITTTPTGGATTTPMSNANETPAQVRGTPRVRRHYSYRLRHPRHVARTATPAAAQ